MQDSDTRALLALHRSPHFSDSVLRQLISAAAAPQQIFSLGCAELNSLKIPPACQQALAALATEGFESLQLEQDWQMLRQQH